MPKKKAEADALTVSVVPITTCPGCKSSISADGKTLHMRSDFLTNLIETDAAVDELEKEIDAKLCAKDTTIADLRAQLKAANEKVAEKEKTTNVNVDTQKRTTAAVATGGDKRKSWYD